LQRSTNRTRRHTITLFKSSREPSAFTQLSTP
jgi:hypothetical protein